MTARPGARFCRGCGGALAGEPTPPAPPPHTPPDEQAGDLGPIVFFMLALLSLTGVVFLVVRSKPSAAPLTELVSLVFLAGLTAWSVRDDPSSVRDLLTAPRLASRQIPQLVGITFAGLGVVVAYFWALHFVLRLPFEHSLSLWKGWPVWMAWATSCVATPILEEIGFRGFLQTRVERLMPIRDALWVQAALFAVLHLSPWAFVSHVLIGLVLGHLRNESRSLYPGMVVHGLWNTLVLVAETRL